MRIQEGGEGSTNDLGRTVSVPKRIIRERG